MFPRVTRAAIVSELSSASRWRIVLARDRRFDGAFVYAVRSTGIYCRPSCPSKRPRQAQVAFFAVPEAAERAGFRACRRCRPAEAAPSDPTVEVVRAACRYLDAHAAEPVSLAALGTAARAAPQRLVRAFRRVLGVTPRQYREARRLSRFKTELRKGKRVSPAVYEAGYGSSSRVSERARGELGTTRSYAEVARTVGNPKATRAVARACATNPAALVIPCHRVVREDGDLGGYRWGVTRKQALLEREAERSAAN